MSEGQGATGLEPEDAEPAAQTAARRSGVDPAALLLAVERLGADVAALSRALAAQPEELAARLDVDAATAAIGVRVGALGSALDQLRLSLLAALDRTTEHIEAPTWLPALQAALAGIGSRIDAPDWAELHAALVDLAPLAAADAGDRLAKVERAVAELADGVRAGAAVGDALDHLGQRLASIEGAAERVADDARVLVERVAPVPDRLTAIANQVDRITPLARAGDQAGSLFDRLDHVGASLVEVLALLRAREGGLVDDEDERFEGLVDVLAGVTRRQDQLTAAIERLDRQEQTVASHLDWVGERLAEVAAHLIRDEAGGAAAGRDDERWEAVVAQLAAVTRRHDELAAASSDSGDEDRSPVAIAAVFDRMEQRERSLAARLDRIDAELRRLGRGASASARSSAAEPGGGLEDRGAGSLAHSVEAIASITEDLARLIESTAERLDRRLARVESSLDQAAQPQPAAPARPSTPPEDAALRLAQLRAERAQVQARLQEERLLAAHTWDEDT